MIRQVHHLRFEDVSPLVLHRPSWANFCRLFANFPNASQTPPTFSQLHQLFTNFTNFSPTSPSSPTCHQLRQLFANFTNFTNFSPTSPTCHQLHQTLRRFHQLFTNFTSFEPPCCSFSLRASRAMSNSSYSLSHPVFHCFNHFSCFEGPHLHQLSPFPICLRFVIHSAFTFYDFHQFVFGLEFTMFTSSPQSFLFWRSWPCFSFARKNGCVGFLGFERTPLKLTKGVVTFGRNICCSRRHHHTHSSICGR